MENSLAHPLFIEFYGLPGCGKSTVSTRVAEWLRVDGYVVDEPSYLEDHKPAFKRKLWKLFVGCSWFLFRHVLYKSISSLVAENGYDGVERFTQSVNLIQKFGIYKRNNTGRIIIWDQGIIQAAISLSIKGKLSASENLQRIKSYLSDDLLILRVYLPTELAVSLKRMECRRTNDSRVEKLDGEESKLNMLRAFETGIDSIRGSYKGGEAEIIANASDRLDANVEFVYHSIKQRL